MKLEDTLSKSHIDLAVNNLSEEQQLLAPVKNTFVHFDDVPCAPPSELIRLHTCPAEVGMSYFFEKIGCSPNSRAVGSTCVVPKPSKMLERSCSAVKSVSWAPTEQEGLMEEVKHTEEKKEPEEEKEPVAADAELGEFFTVKKGKKQRHAGARLAAQPKQHAAAAVDAAIVEASAIVDHASIAQPVQTEQPADEKRSSSEVLAASALEPTSATEGKSPRPSLDDADLEETTKEESTSVMSSAPVKARPRWVDLEETDVDEEAAARPAAPAAKPAASRRPTFGRPGREARVRHSKADAAEICALEFDTVDASSQSGLVGRMLVMLKSLAQPVVFWEKAEQAGAEEEKREAEKFRLLGLEEDDMYAIGRRIRKADKKISDRQFREAFNEMCEARRWLQNDQEWAEAQRARRRAEKAAVREPKTREAPRTKKNEVKEQAAAAAALEVADDDDEWQTVGGAAAAEKKKRTAAPEKTTSTSSSYAAGTPAPRATGTTNKGPRRWCAEGQPAAACRQPARQAAVAPPPPAVERRYPAAATTSPVGVGQPPSRGEGTKFLCRFAVGIEAEVKGGFRVCRRIFGPGGENMKSIAREANAKLRLRGRGSGFKEGPELREADEPLVLCVSAEAREGYRLAVQSVSALFERIYQDYKVHCEKHRLPLDPELAVRLQEHPGNPHC